MTSSEHSALVKIHILGILALQATKDNNCSFQKVPYNCVLGGLQASTACIHVWTFFSLQAGSSRTFWKTFCKNKIHIFLILANQATKTQTHGLFLERKTQLFLSVKLQEISLYKYKHTSMVFEEELTHKEWDLSQSEYSHYFQKLSKQQTNFSTKPFSFSSSSSINKQKSNKKTTHHHYENKQKLKKNNPCFFLFFLSPTFPLQRYIIFPFPLSSRFFFIFSSSFRALSLSLHLFYIKYTHQSRVLWS